MFFAKKSWSILHIQLTSCYFSHMANVQITIQYVFNYIF